MNEKPDISPADRAGEEAVWHKRMAQGHLIGSLIGVILFCIALVPAAPLFIKMFLPFPKLEDATHWVGRIETEGKFDVGKFGNATYPRQFIVTPTGKHEFFCGYFGRRIGCSEYQLLNGASGEVWHHPAFGAIQARFVIGLGPQQGRIVEQPLWVEEKHFRERFNYDRYISRLFVALAPLAYVIFWAYPQFRRHRVAASSAPVVNQSTNTTTEI
jgi:hypothetical protein